MNAESDKKSSLPVTTDLDRWRLYAEADKLQRLVVSAEAGGAAVTNISQIEQQAAGGTPSRSILIEGGIIDENGDINKMLMVLNAKLFETEKKIPHQKPDMELWKLYAAAHELQDVLVEAEMKGQTINNVAQIRAEMMAARISQPVLEKAGVVGDDGSIDRVRVGIYADAFVKEQSSVISRL